MAIAAHQREAGSTSAASRRNQSAQGIGYAVQQWEMVLDDLSVLSLSG